MSQDAAIDKRVVIVGAGLAGALLACYFGKLGWQVRLHERRGDPRAKGYTGGRSINLALSARGLWGMEGIGVRDEVLQHALPMRGRMMHPGTPGAPVYFQPYSKDPQEAINSISRGGLNIALLNAASKYPNVTLLFNQRCLDVDLDRPTATFADETPDHAIGGKAPESTVDADLIIGADGAFSAVRAKMQKTDRFEYQQTFLGHGYKELHIPPLSAEHPNFSVFGGWAMDPSALHIWPRGKAMMIALPNPDRSFTCTLFWPFEGDHALSNLTSAEQVRSFFLQHYPDAVPIMPTLEQDFLSNPNGSLVTVKCWPWAHFSAGGKGVVLVGDAAHAIVPFFGQGMNAAFEDVRVLSELIGAKSSLGSADWLHAALREYQSARKINADAIARMAQDNFIEMRDKVGSKLFLYRKKLEHFLHDLFPRTLVPKYNLVSFSTVPYSEALKRGARLDRIIRVCILIVAVLACVALAIVGIPQWFLLIAAVVAAWLIWDHWQFQRDSTP